MRICITAPGRDDTETTSFFHCRCAMLKLVNARKAPKISSVDQFEDGFDTLEPKDQKQVREWIDEYGELPKSELKRKLADLGFVEQPKQKKAKKAKVEKKPTGEMLLPEAMFQGDAKSAMDLFLVACRQEKLKVPGDEKAARSKLGGYLMQHRGENSTWNLRGAFQSAKKELKPSSTLDGVMCPANQGLVDMFMQLREAYFKAGNSHGGISALKVAKAMKAVDYPITSGKAVSSGKGKLDGVGKSSGKKIDEFLETGTCTKLEELMA